MHSPAPSVSSQSCAHAIQPVVASKWFSIALTVSGIALAALAALGSYQHFLCFPGQVALYAGGGALFTVGAVRGLYLLGKYALKMIRLHNISLQTAANNGNMQALRYHLKRGVDVNALDQFGDAALHRACYWGREEAVQELLKQEGVDVNVRTAKSQDTPLMKAILNMESTKVVDILLTDERVDLDAQNAYGKTALHVAAQNDEPTFVEQILNSRRTFDVNLPDNDGRTPLLTALEKLERQKVALVLAQHADVKGDVQDNEGNRPLHRACELGAKEVVQALLKKDDIDVNLRDAHYQLTPLQHAAWQGHKDIVSLLLAQPQTDPRTASKDNWGAYDSISDAIKQMIQDKIDQDASSV